MIEADRKRRSRNPLRLTETQRLMDAAVRDPRNHVFAAWLFDAVGKYRPLRTRVSLGATAKVAVSDDSARDEPTARALARTALVDSQFVPADLSLGRHDTSDTIGKVDVVITLVE